jgi:hypothetical protein
MNHFRQSGAGIIYFFRFSFVFCPILFGSDDYLFIFAALLYEIGHRNEVFFRYVKFYTNPISTGRSSERGRLFMLTGKTFREEKRDYKNQIKEHATYENFEISCFMYCNPCRSLLLQRKRAGYRRIGRRPATGRPVGY